MRASKGTVALEIKQGKIRLRLPRSVAEGSARYISTRLDSTPENLRKAKILALNIESDIATGNLDPTLERYKVHKQIKSQIRLCERPKTLLELWDLYCDYQRSQVALTTFRKDYQTKYRNHIKALPTLDLRDAQAIKTFLITHKTPDTTQRVLTYLSACCQWATEAGLVPSNPFSDMAKSVKVRHSYQIDPFSPSERDRILAAFQTHKPHYYPFVRFLFMTGCRTGEAIALKWSQVSPDCSTITFSESYNSDLKILKDTKTHKSRRFPCNPALKGLLTELRANRDPKQSLVFPGVEGGYMNASQFTHRVWKGGKSGKKVYRGLLSDLVSQGLVERYRSPYNTRHTFITTMLESGLSIPQVARLVGNSPQVLLQHYAGIIETIQIPDMGC